MKFSAANAVRCSPAMLLKLLRLLFETAVRYFTHSPLTFLCQLSQQPLSCLLDVFY